MALTHLRRQDHRAIIGIQRTESSQKKQDCQLSKKLQMEDETGASFEECIATK